MTRRIDSLREALNNECGSMLDEIVEERGELTVIVPLDQWLTVATTLRDAESLSFETLIDLCVVDYLLYGVSEWKTESATESGFSRGVATAEVIADYDTPFDERRFGVTVHLLSIRHNRRVRLRCFTGNANPPLVPSLVEVWPGVNWFEREAFDLFGVLFEGHPDLRRILTDYGFIGHPFRKDFPLSGNVEVRYDPEKSRVAYQPVSIEPRTLVPKVIRDDNRYADGLKASGDE